MTNRREDQRMLTDSPAFSGFSVSDPGRARTFYAETLGLRVEDGNGGMFFLKLAGGRDTLVYPSPQHAPASYTVLNFPVDDIEAAVDELVGRGVVFTKYDGIPTDERGIMREGGPLIAWFTDPAGNVLSVIEQ
jgi:catechol 2,3-dioxygenase-like lactoylglutathione lyase family enzyme